jgi:prophage regulatory protein
MSVIPIKPRPEPELRRARDVGRGRRPQRMSKPVIYFAGRMAGCKHCTDWRDAVAGFEGLYGHGELYSDHDEVLVGKNIVDCNTFWYGGPFIINGTGGHNLGHTAFAEAHRLIWDVDKAQIERADLMFGYLEDVQAYGTLVEIGYAAALRKPIALGFSDVMERDDYRELWLARMTAARVYRGTVEEVWSQVRADWIDTARELRQ